MTIKFLYGEKSLLHRRRNIPKFIVALHDADIVVNKHNKTKQG